MVKGGPDLDKARVSKIFVISWFQLQGTSNKSLPMVRRLSRASLPIKVFRHANLPAARGTLNDGVRRRCAKKFVRRRRERSGDVTCSGVGAHAGSDDRCCDCSSAGRASDKMEADVLGWKIGRPTFLDSIPVDACLALRCVGEWDFSPCLLSYS
ncbi:hypothetical protein TNIN_90951 [Trichonephila inaurata madagascariensis]|uniref:Uncharacterized protein n=1 Tax=Trichonephila inaurata madagascariensis TaxID=2747483 RepID=A0A8X6I5W4_9ARAC|nr:hypothetical protein TNIN_90951 [Trichonephila inaurata madagascariensis]